MANKFAIYKDFLSGKIESGSQSAVVYSTSMPGNLFSNKKICLTAPVSENLTQLNIIGGLTNQPELGIQLISITPTENTYYNLDLTNIFMPYFFFRFEGSPNVGTVLLYYNVYE